MCGLVELAVNEHVLLLRGEALKLPEFGQRSRGDQPGLNTRKDP
jgi:hypothetical protein